MKAKKKKKERESVFCDRCSRRQSRRWRRRLQHRRSLWILLNLFFLQLLLFSLFQLLIQYHWKKNNFWDFIIFLFSWDGQDNSRAFRRLFFLLLLINSCAISINSLFLVNVHSFQYHFLFLLMSFLVFFLFYLDSNATTSRNEHLQVIDLISPHQNKWFIRLQRFAIINDDVDNDETTESFESIKSLRQ